MIDRFFPSVVFLLQSIIHFHLLYILAARDGSVVLSKQRGTAPSLFDVSRRGSVARQSRSYRRAEFSRRSPAIGKRMRDDDDDTW